jgi:hypothetical protein
LKLVIKNYYTVISASSNTATWMHGTPTYEMIIYPSTDRGPLDTPGTTGPIDTSDHSVMLNQGYIYKPDDWRNVEMTCYYSVFARKSAES